jgi:hypothetical protein
VPGSNRRPPARKARTAAAVSRRLSLRTLGERWSAHGCRVLLRFATSKPLPNRLEPGQPAGPGSQRVPSRPRAACLWRPGQSLADTGAHVVAPPAEASLVWLRRERRARKVAPPKRRSYSTGVRSFGHRDGTTKPGTGAAHVQDLARTCPAVRADTVRCAVVVGIEHPANAAKRAGLRLGMCGGHGNASMSPTEWSQPLECASLRVQSMAFTF